ncbi:hypothetical protein ABT063_49390 [Streptomyces sp. NPDC002838]|uniref:hypothetical protein n=1 Tax=Streptomyces sp. NPDC002838 TaxID=3154436 RepID=UPI00331A076A
MAQTLIGRPGWPPGKSQGESVRAQDGVAAANPDLVKGQVSDRLGQVEGNIVGRAAPVRHRGQAFTAVQLQVARGPNHTTGWPPTAPAGTPHGPTMTPTMPPRAPPRQVSTLLATPVGR